MLKMNDYSTANDRFYCNVHYQQLYLANSNYAH